MGCFKGERNGSQQRNPESIFVLKITPFPESREKEHNFQSVGVKKLKYWATEPYAVHMTKGYMP
jgi:hypothetical protein